MHTYRTRSRASHPQSVSCRPNKACLTKHIAKHNPVGRGLYGCAALCQNRKPLRLFDWEISAGSVGVCARDVCRLLVESCCAVVCLRHQTDRSICMMSYGALLVVKKGWHVNIRSQFTRLFLARNKSCSSELTFVLLIECSRKLHIVHHVLPTTTNDNLCTQKAISITQISCDRLHKPT